MAKRPCARPGCGELVARGYYCTEHQRTSPAATTERRRSERPSKKWYNSARWRRKRMHQLSSEPLCADIYGAHAKERRPVAATVADHIEPHGEDEWKFWNNGLQSLCCSCHSHKTASEDGGFGRQLVSRG